ncbi:uncharacterized protein ACIBXB_003803 isoform 2-T4 [Morphnus guianensis]
MPKVQEVDGKTQPPLSFCQHALETALCQSSQATSVTRHQRNRIIWTGEPWHGTNVLFIASNNGQLLDIRLETRDQIHLW